MTDNERVAEIRERYNDKQSALATDAQFLLKLLEERDELCERLKQEAGIHAQEAQTANATLAEIYQLCSSAKGEPGNWHGAEPVRKALEEREQVVKGLVGTLQIILRCSKEDDTIDAARTVLARAKERAGQ